MSWFAAGGNNWDYLGRKKGLKIGRIGGRWCQVLDGSFRYFVSY